MEVEASLWDGEIFGGQSLDADVLVTFHLYFTKKKTTVRFTDHEAAQIPTSAVSGHELLSVWIFLPNHHSVMSCHGH